MFVRDETVIHAGEVDAVLCGASGGPKWDDLPEARPKAGMDGLTRMRRELDLYANIRPSRCLPALENASTLKPEIVAGVGLVTGSTTGEGGANMIIASDATVTLTAGDLTSQFITLIGFQASALLGGSLFVELIFNVPGLGSYGVDAIFRGNVPALLGFVMVIAVVVVVIRIGRTLDRPATSTARSRR